jgi:hypothetical protein
MPPLDGGGFNSFILGLMATACSIFAFQFDAKAECLYLFLIAASDLLEAWQASQMTHHISPLSYVSGRVQSQNWRRIYIFQFLRNFEYKEALEAYHAEGCTVGGWISGAWNVHSMLMVVCPGD